MYTINLVHCVHMFRNRPGYGQRINRTEQLHLRATSEQLGRWKAAAESQGMGLSRWVSRLLDEVALAYEKDPIEEAATQMHARRRQQLAKLERRGKSDAALAQLATLPKRAGAFARAQALADLDPPDGE